MANRIPSPWTTHPLNRSQSLLTAEDLHRLPALGSTDSTPLDEKMVVVHFSTPDWNFWAAEFDPDSGAFAGFVQTIHGLEWGTISLRDLLGMQRPGQVLERDEHWIPRHLDS